MKKNYGIGIDIGTSSVGWAVMNLDNYKIMRKGNKKMWGVLLFDEANTAKERRMYRSQRRRYNRRRERINTLQSLFKEEINKVDNNFFDKLNESFLLEEDRQIKNAFNSKQVNDYFFKYPTIYHLRKSLMTEDKKFDIRLVYLALHHIIKYRGNFNYNISGFNLDNIDIKEKLINIFSNMNEICTNIIFNKDDIDINKIKNILDSDMVKKDRQISLNTELKKVLPEKISSQLSKLIVGNKSKLNVIFDLDDTVEISFSDTNYDEKILDKSSILDKNIEIVEELKELYDMILLKDMFKGKNYTSISMLMIDKYGKQNKDLGKLRKILKLDRKIYNEFFTNNKELCIYSKYIKNKLNYDEFKKYILKAFEQIEKQNIKDDYKNIINEIKEELEQEVFIPRITSVENSIYPYQLNEQELIKIINNQSKYYKFLSEKVDNEFKLVKLLKFRIPYYIGPLNSSSKYSWLIRKSNDKITPFNFYDVVDREESAEKFILKSISNCTYLLEEKVIPASSILYSKFKVLNELKNIKVVCPKRTDKLSIELQNKIFNDFFLKTKGQITNKKFYEYLKSLDEFEMYEGNFEIKGYGEDERFANNMQSYIDFFSDDGIFKNTKYTIENAEEIIKWITIFEDKDILKTKLHNKYGDLGEEAINKILTKNYKGWSELSEKLLTTKWYLNKEDNELYSIMDLLEQTDKNFMQIIYDKKYNFQEFIKQNNKYMKEEKIGYDLVEDLYTSPANKKGIYLSLKLIEQIVDYIGYEPKSISIEMAREDEEKGQRTDSRQKLLENIYSKYSKSIDNYNKLNKELNKYETYTNINKEKLFHYFLQEGKCLYCGKSLNIDSLSTDCEIDHIIPQSLIKDDSIDNKALVHKEHNQEKAASVVLPVNFRNHSNIEWWNKLLRCRLISHKKFSNLIRSKFRDEDIEGFINRQLVETRQITKHVANILGNIYKNTKIIYLKANLSSNYRNKNQMFKYRDLNDYHHAHDAYLAIALGEYKEKLNTITFDELKERTKRSFEKGIYNKQYGYVLNQIDENIYDEKTGEVIFDSKQFNDTVINTLYQNDIIVNKKTEIRTGEFYNQTKYKKTDKNKGYKIKDNLPVEKYGYYDSIKPSYISLVKYGDKQKLIGIPIIIDLKSKKDNNIKIDYIRNLLKIKKDVEIKILIEKIPFYTLINFDGKICSIVGASDSIEVCNAIEFNIDKSNQIKWKYTLHKLLNNKSLDHVINLSKKYNEKSTYNEDVYEKQIDEIIDYIFKKVDEKYLLYKDSFIKLRKSLNDVYSTIKLEDKEKLIKELLRLLKYNSSTASLKFLGSEFADGYGRKKGQSITHATIYNKSISGLKGNKNEF